ncbi:hypothetical protein FRC03_008254 [Tulasnella sp. 419]|nr:hypothetical protein FRC03_008254 [Tulasnella sp. 419]
MRILSASQVHEGPSSGEFSWKVGVGLGIGSIFVIISVLLLSHYRGWIRWNLIDAIKALAAVADLYRIRHAEVTHDTLYATAAASRTGPIRWVPFGIIPLAPLNTPMTGMSEISLVPGRTQTIVDRSASDERLVMDPDDILHSVDPVQRADPPASARNLCSSVLCV